MQKYFEKHKNIPNHKKYMFVTVMQIYTFEISGKGGVTKNEKHSLLRKVGSNLRGLIISEKNQQLGNSINLG